MNKKFRSSSILDIVGVVALTGAVSALGGIFWTTSLFPESTLFTAFHACLAVGLASFLGNRVLDIARVIAETPDPKSLRAQPRVDTAVLAVAEHNNVTDGKFRQAA